MKEIITKTDCKLAFFDFDRTLIVHNYSREFMDARQESYFQKCVWALTALEKEHANDRPLPCMQWYVKKLYMEGYELYCLTHEIFNLHDELKKDQLYLFYHDTPMTYLTVDDPDHKIDMMLALTKVKGCTPDDIIFVDDLINTVDKALAEGINAKHLSDIVVLYESLKDFHEQDLMVKPVNDNEMLGVAQTVVEEVLAEMDLAEKSQAQIYEECRRLAEMNGRTKVAEMISRC